jgi:hypothetical protein
VIKYKAVGSGAGLEMLANEEADFAASESFITKDMKGISEREWRMIPVFATGFAITYNSADFVIGDSFDGVPQLPQNLISLIFPSAGFQPAPCPRSYAPSSSKFVLAIKSLFNPCSCTPS